MYSDLHIHSWYSDGTLSPKKIIAKAKTKNMELISICDHNLIDAYTKCNFIEMCAKNSIKAITGVEIHTLMDFAEYHILAYGFDTQNEALNDLLEYNRGILYDRGKSLIKSAEKDYPTISLEEFLRYERVRINGGWESIDYLKRKKIIKGVHDFFRLLRKYSPKADQDFLPPKKVIEIIHSAGGYAVVAHLGDNLKQNLSACQRTAVQFLNAGIDGFECYYPSHTDRITEYLVELCYDLDLMITTGGDEHGGFNNFSGGCVYNIGVLKVDIDQLNLRELI